MKTLKLLIGDPAKSGDSFGVVGLDGTWPERKIYGRHAGSFTAVTTNPGSSEYSALTALASFIAVLGGKNSYGLWD